MNRFLYVAVFLLLTSSRVVAQEAIFPADAKLKVEAEGGAGGEGPAWDPKLGVLSSGNGHIYRLDRDGKSTIHRKGPLACAAG
jgi:gluconolactonase